MLQMHGLSYYCVFASLVLKWLSLVTFFSVFELKRSVVSLSHCGVVHKWACFGAGGGDTEQREEVGKKKQKNIQCHNRGQKEDWKLMLSVIYCKWWKTSCQKKEKKNLQNSSFSSLWLLNSSGRNQLVWHPELFFLYKCFPRYMEDGVDHTHYSWCKKHTAE